MLPKNSRLPLAGIFKRKPVFENHSTCAVLKCFKNEAGKRRVGVVAPKKVFAKPTARNRVKRAVFRIFEQQPDLFPKNDVLIIIQPRAGAAPHEELVEQLRVFIKKTNRNAPEHPVFRN